MRHLLLFILLLVSQFSYAQVSLYLVSESKARFEILIDDFVQNTQPVKELLISGLDTSEHQLSIVVFKDGEQEVIRRKLKMIEPGQHRYIIDENFVGEQQLRYRGKVNEIPAGVIKMKLQRTLRRYIPNVEKPVVTSAPKPEIDSTVATKPVVSNIPVAINTDTITIAAPAEVPVSKFSLEALLSEMKSAEFEFVKLNIAIDHTQSESLSVNEVEQLLKHLDYDNTRLQFIEHIKERISDKEKLKELEGALEFELSRERFRNSFL